MHAQFILITTEEVWINSSICVGNRALFTANSQKAAVIPIKMMMMMLLLLTPSSPPKPCQTNYLTCQQLCLFLYAYVWWGKTEWLYLRNWTVVFNFHHYCALYDPTVALSFHITTYILHARCLELCTALTLMADNDILKAIFMPSKSTEKQKRRHNLPK